MIWHELNNSLAPIKSVIETSRDALAAGSPDKAEREELAHNLALVAERAESLRRFLSRYSELARMPEPTIADCDVGGAAAAGGRRPARRAGAVRGGGLA